MKKLIAFTALFYATVAAIAGTASASEATTKTYALFNKPNYELTGCDIGTRITITTVDEKTARAHLTNFVAGFCEIYVNPNPRDYVLETRDAGCGSVVHTGTLETAEGVRSLEVLDHRPRLCRDLQPAELVVTETHANGFAETLYSQPRFPKHAGPQLPGSAPVNADDLIDLFDGGMTCMAFWAGYEFEGGECKARSASGCFNPFPYASLDECKVSNNL